MRLLEELRCFRRRYSQLRDRNQPPAIAVVRLHVDGLVWEAVQLGTKDKLCSVFVVFKRPDYNRYVIRPVI